MSLLVCNLLIVITSLYRLFRTPPRIVEVGKSPIIPNLEDSGSELPSNNCSDTGGSEGATADVNVSETEGRRGDGRSTDIGSYPIAATPSTTIELTELFESDLSFA